MGQDDLKKNLAERFEALLAQGVTRFPRPSEAPLPEAEVESASQTPTPGDTVAADPCPNCPLAAQRKRIVASARTTRAPIMVIADFPSPDDENSTDPQLFASPAGESAVLHNLLQRLGHPPEAVHRAFALKCVPHRGIPNGALATCAALLAREIRSVDPDVILAFGLRTCQVLAGIAGTSLPPPPEAGEWGTFALAGRNRRTLALPSFRELSAFKEWRAATWQALQGLRRG